MEPDKWPADRATALERVRDIIQDLDDASEDDTTVMLSNFLCSAWGSITAQNQ